MFTQNKKLIFATSTIKDGNMSYKFDTEDVVKNNRKVFLEKNNIEMKDCVVPYLSHSDTIKIVTDADKGEGMFSNLDGIDAEALITNTKGLGLFLHTADCFPVSFFDTKKEVIALAHCGWKPIDKRLVYKTVLEMIKVFNSDPKDILVYIGPGIKKDSYIFKEPIQKTVDYWKSYLEDMEDGQTKIDLTSFIVDQLKEAGIPLGNIEINQTNTATNTEYFSHYRSERADEREGRFATVVYMV